MISFRTIRRFLIQGLALSAVVALVWAAAVTASGNLQDRGITSGFAFLSQPAGYDIGFTLIDYQLESTHGRVFLIGMLNTLFISALGIVLATGLGVVLGVLRLSGNILMAGLVTGYVEILRNIPLPLQILFWYGLLQALPTVREGSLSLGDVIFLNNRGLEIPRPELSGDLTLFWVGVAIAIFGMGLMSMWAARRRASGRRVPPLWPWLLLVMVTAPTVGGLVSDGTVSWDVPQAGRFNFSGGISILPTFVALLASLTLYTAAFIAEIVRSGIQSVPRGQGEAAAALGLAPGEAMGRIILPQALRVIVPPLTSQYLNLLKNSSLGLVIGYPDLMATFGSTTMSQTGQAIETIFLVMAFYLVISLLISAVMNVYNRAVRLKER